MTFFLVKTGDVKPGSLDGISFPSVKYTWIDNGSTEKPVGIPLTYVNFKFSGLLNVTVPSCTTPGDFSVSLGSYDISVLKKDGTTPWKNVGLKLTNCPAFSGYNGGTDTVWNITQPGDSTVVSGPSDGFRSNTLGVTLNPISGIIDAAKGTFNIDNSVTHSASGVALQLASGSTASQVPVNLGTRSEIVLSRTESPSSIDIPLVARIVKTTDNPTPGNVISKVTYLIDYK
jgi:type 1 fimbria pilin